MHEIVRQRLPRVHELCRRYGVRRLDLFGSAAAGTFDPMKSDLDFLVEFEPATSGFADRYFGLLESLEALFDRSVDLVEAQAITNEYFRQGVLRNCERLYAA